MNIVIADDHPVIRHALKLLLSDDDSFYIVGEAKDGPEAVEHISKFKPDILITDIRMPGMDGIEVARQARAISPGTKVIIHTVHGWSFYHRMSWISRAIYVFLERLTARLSCKLITVTPVDVKKGLEYGVGRPDKYVTIRSGIEFSRFDKFDQDAVNAFREGFKGKANPR